jgi:hypothetical protein
MEVNRPFADAGFLRDIFDRHLLVAVAREQTIGGIEDEVLAGLGISG